MNSATDSACLLLKFTLCVTNPTVALKLDDLVHEYGSVKRGRNYYPNSRSLFKLLSLLDVLVPVLYVEDLFITFSQHIIIEHAAPLT